MTDPILTPEQVVAMTRTDKRGDRLTVTPELLALLDASTHPSDQYAATLWREIVFLQQRAAEDAATIARLREHLALSEQHKLVAIESRRDREAEVARLTQERDEARVDRDRAERISQARRDALLKAEVVLATLRAQVMTVVSDPHLTWRKARALLAAVLNRLTPQPEEPR